MKRLLLSAWVMVLTVLSLHGQEIHKGGYVQTPLDDSGHKIVTFQFLTKEGNIGDDVILRFKDADGNVLYETYAGRKENSVFRVSIKVELFDFHPSGMMTVYPEFVIGDKQVNMQPMQVPKGLFERLKVLQNPSNDPGQNEKSN